MTTKAGIEKFLNQKSLAIVGVSRNEKKFSNMMYKKLKAKGYRLFAINPNTEILNDEPCYNSIQSLPQAVDGVVIVVPRKQSEGIVMDAITAGISHIWIQQGAESSEAISQCKKSGINVIHNQCILMHAEPSTFPHSFHRRILKTFGKLPK